MTEERSLQGLTALVTGSSRNLGAAIAVELATRGATVAITYKTSRGEALALARRIGSETGGSHPVLQADLSSGDKTRDFLDRFIAEVGSADILVNNTGPFSMEPFTELSEEEWDRIWDSNVKAAQLCAKRLAPGMRERGRGRIVNISAGSAYIRNHSIYTLSKAALITLTEVLALELGPEITVNAVAPGQIAESAEDIAELDPSFVERAIEHTPIERLVTRSEVASIVADLCGPRYDGVTGVTIPIDGGWRLNRF
jgi:NAD(P)-dependent dehydrogenase (short-subunit alcohol dehydrogenase family)